MSRKHRYHTDKPVRIHFLYLDGALHREGNFPFSDFLPFLENSWVYKYLKRTIPLHYSRFRETAYAFARAIRELGRYRSAG